MYAFSFFLQDFRVPRFYCTLLPSLTCMSFVFFVRRSNSWSTFPWTSPFKNGEHFRLISFKHSAWYLWPHTNILESRDNRLVCNRFIPWDYSFCSKRRWGRWWIWAIIPMAGISMSELFTVFPFFFSLTNSLRFRFITPSVVIQ